jgi:prolyl-tRNA editing enzyme YbaK/EbsC (Cys-tRNA(Pro) deacylase)
MNTAPLPESSLRVAKAARECGLEVRIVEMAETTRTAEEAARACGCEPAQIMKSLIFRGSETGRPYLLLVSGKNRVNEAKVARVIGEVLARPDAAYVRDVTGFAIGGVPPLGHATALRTFIDPDLLAFPTVWAAAGTPRCVMEVDPQALKQSTEATEIAMN